MSSYLKCFPGTMQFGGNSALGQKKELWTYQLCQSGLCDSGQATTLYGS